MASWMETFLCSELLQIGSSSFKTIKDHHPLESAFPSLSVQEEASKILTHMILSHQKELRSHFV